MPAPLTTPLTHGTSAALKAPPCWARQNLKNLQFCTPAELTRDLLTSLYLIQWLCTQDAWHTRTHRLALQNRAAARNVPLTVNTWSTHLLADDY